MKKLHFFTTIIILMIFSISCSDDSNNGSSSNQRTIKYEITGTYSGNLFVVYSDVDGSPIAEEVTSLPWVKQVTYQNGTIAAGISAGSNISELGLPGQNGSVKMIIGNEVKRQSNKTTDQTGFINFDALSYTFE